MIAMAAEKVAWDYVTGSVVMLGVALTLAAVLVALFGPTWRERRRRPILSLTGLDAAHEYWDSATAVDHSEALLLLTAQCGRDTAEDVEIHLSVAAPPFLEGHQPMRVFRGT
jgi:hypothetical protein